VPTLRQRRLRARHAAYLAKRGPAEFCDDCERLALRACRRCGIAGHEGKCTVPTDLAILVFTSVMDLGLRDEFLCETCSR
jgi:hypothetical protein